MELPATTARTYVRRGVELLVLLGGALITWLVLCSAPAHADDASGQHGRAVGAPVTGAAEDATSAVRRTTKAATGHVATTSKATTKQLARSTARLPEPIAEVGSQAATTLDRTVERAADTVSTTVTHSTESVDHLVESAIDQPSAPSTERVQTTATTTTSPSPGPAAGTPSQPADHVRPHSRTAPRALDTGAKPRAASADPVDTPAQEQPRPYAPEGPSGPALPGSTTTITPAGTAHLAAPTASVATTPPVRRAPGDDAVPTGPADAPDSSPD